MTESRSGTTVFKNRKKFTAALLCLIGIFIIGDIDYATGYQISLLVFYILPVGFATIYVGPAFAIFLAILSIAISVCTDFWAGMPYAEIPILGWNVTIVLSVFIIVIGLLHALNRILLRLESSIEERSRDLFNEMSERGRMEREIIELSERERRRFGQELHDVVCQELASVTIAAHMLARKLLATEHDETALAREIARMTDHALETTRSVARGFFTAGFDGAGLAEALREAARYTTEHHCIPCVVHWQENLVITNEDIVIHLFRIAQEAIRNVVKHAAASHIEVSLRCEDKMFRLTIEDNGRGLSAPNGERKGLGLRIMSYRAKLIGGEFKTEHPPKGGTRVVCQVPIEKLKRPVTEIAS
jgi:signal transduction histidine kinase